MRTAIPPMWPGYAICGLSLLLVLSLALRGFSPGTPVSKFQFDDSRNQVDEERLCGCATSKIGIYLFLYLLLGGD